MSDDQFITVLHKFLDKLKEFSVRMDVYEERMSGVEGQLSDLKKKCDEREVFYRRETK